MTNTLTKADQNKERPQVETFFTPPTNIREEKEAYVLEVEMAGVGKEGIDVTVEEN